MKSLFLFPFRVIAFLLRVTLRIITIPLVILFSILGLLLPETGRALNSTVSTFIRIFKF